MGVKQLKLNFKMITSIALLLTLLFAGAVAVSADDAAAEATGDGSTVAYEASVTPSGGGTPQNMQHLLKL